MPKAKLVTICDEDKGEPIRFKGTTYGGKTGWMDESNGLHPPKSFYVIVDAGTGNGKGYYATVRRTTVEVPHTQPTSQFTLAIQKHDGIEQKVDSLVALLAKCKIQPDDTELYTYIQSKLAMAQHRKKVAAGKALYYDINFGACDPDQKMNSGL